MTHLKNYQKPSHLPAEIPVFPLTGALLLPRTELPLNVFEPRYLEMFDDAMKNDRIVGMIQPLAGDISDVPKLLEIGCAGRITSYSETPDGRLLVTLTGIARFKVLEELETSRPYRRVHADYRSFAIDFASGIGAEQVNRSALLKAFRDYLEANNMTTNWEDVESVNTEQLVNVLSLMAPYPAHEKQALLEAPDLKSRADTLVALTELALVRQGGGKGTRLQ
jgi:uncharacterized protein